MISRWLPDGTRIYINDAYCRAFGRARESLIGNNLIEETPPEERQAIRDKVASITPEHPVGTSLHRLFRPDGSVAWHEWTDRGTFDADGNLIEIQGVGRDVTDRVLAEEALRQSEARYRAIVENQAEMVSRWLPDGTRTFFNDAYCRAFGRARVSLIGTNLIAEALPEEQQAIRDKVARMTPEQPIQTSLHRFGRADGSIAWHEWTDQGIFDADGKLIEIQGVGRDVTDRVLAQEALAENQRFTESIIQATPSIVYVFDLQKLHPVYINQRAISILGYTLEDIEAMGSNLLSELIYPEDLPTLSNALQYVQAVRDDAAISFEFRARGKDGYRWFMGYLGVLKWDEQGHVQLVIGVAQDITELKIAEAQRMELQIKQTRLQFLEGLIDDLSHDVKTPITAIQASLYLIRHQNDPTKLPMYLERIGIQTARLEKMVDNILILSRLDQGLSMMTTLLRLEDIMRQVIEQEQSAAHDKGIQIALHTPPPTPLIQMDSIELWRAFNNLLENAIRYTPAGGQITVTIAAVDNGVQASIQDTGIGIDEDDLPHIFEPFYRVDKSRNAYSGGSGLGLAIVKKVVELHGGKIEVDSRLGEGTTFRVWLPATSPAAAAG